MRNVFYLMTKKNQCESKAFRYSLRSYLVKSSTEPSAEYYSCALGHSMQLNSPQVEKKWHKNDTNNDGVILVARKFFVYDVDEKIIELGVKVPHSVRKAGLPDLWVHCCKYDIISIHADYDNQKWALLII